MIEAVTSKQIVVKGEQVLLLAEKALFIEKSKTLVIADLHLGKANHFRKNGIYVPAFDELKAIESLCSKWAPQKLVFLGDLFHSSKNEVITPFQNLLGMLCAPKILVYGNHDILHPEIYRSLGLECTKELEMGDLVFLHEHENRPGKFVISGHVHPSIHLTGRGKQGIRLSAFVMREEGIILPAFGCFTGNFSVEKEKNCIFYAITGNKIFTIA